MIKLKSIFTALLLSFCTLCLPSCSDDDVNPISLQDIENSSLYLVYPRSGAYTTAISGGDGSYTASSGNSQILSAEVVNGQTLTCTPLSVGQTTIAITDRSNNLYTLNVTVAYVEQSYLVVKNEVAVTGNSLTVGEKKEIEENALSSMLVKPNGGYKFVYTDMEATRGEAYIYPEKLGDTGIKGTFERGTAAVEGSLSKMTYVITANKNVYTLILTPYTGTITQSSVEPYMPFVFFENLTEKYKPHYSNVENVYTSQIMVYKRSL